MRTIIYGVGAIGGTIAAQLSLAGHTVVGIGRGAQLEAIRSNGITLHTPEGSKVARLPIHADISEIALQPDDAILLTMKGQDTLAALVRLRSVGAAEQPVFCFQNGVSNELLALRFFDNIYGATVMLPAELTSPGEISAYFSPGPGAFDIGRFPSGVDGTAGKLGDMLADSGFIVSLRDDVMASKYRKLLTNLNNIIGAAMRDAQSREAWLKKVTAEAHAVLEAAGIVWDRVYSPARDHLELKEVLGRKSSGSSTFQSLARGTGTIETDYLNGEIVLLGRLHGVATPVNAAFCRLSAELVAGRMEPRSASDETVRALMTDKSAA